MNAKPSPAIVWSDPEPFVASNGRSALVMHPVGISTHDLPVLYLFHGQFDCEKDWWSDAKGNIRSTLEKLKAPPMLVVAPFCALQKLELPKAQTEPELKKFQKQFEVLRQEILAWRQLNPKVEGVLGISMGGKQAASVVLNNLKNFKMLGVLSGKFQGHNYHELKCSSSYPQDLGKSLRLYYHYCGDQEEVFEPNNAVVSKELGGELIRGKGGAHNWNFWRPRVDEFVQKLSDALQSF